MGLAGFVGAAAAGWLLLHAAVLGAGRWLPARVQRRLARLLGAPRLSWSQLVWTTERWSRTLARLGKAAGAPLRLWFSLGACFGCVVMAVGPLLLLGSVGGSLRALLHKAAQWQQQHALAEDPQGRIDTQTAMAGSAGAAEDTVLMPILPGVTVPLSHFGFLFLTLLINGLLHELGHALAAAGEGVRMEACGAFVAWAVYPGAFVALHTQQLQQAPPWRQLRIYCAGVWHNAVLALLAAAVLAGLPTLVAPWFLRNHGIAVTEVAPYSPLYSELQPGDIFTSIDKSCAVITPTGWHMCLNHLQHSLDRGQSGFCLPASVVHERDSHSAVWTDPETGWLECCGADPAGAVTRLCFHSGNSSSSSSSRSSRSGAAFKTASESVACLSARMVMSRSPRRCANTSDCAADAVCLKHTAEAPSTHLFQIGRRNKESIIFMGHAQEVMSAVAVTGYLPRTPCLLCQLFPTLPETLGTMMRYLLSLSAALAVLNILPAFYLDGQFAVVAFLDAVFPRHVLSVENRETISALTLFLGSALLVVSVVLSFLQMALV